MHRSIKILCPLLIIALFATDAFACRSCSIGLFARARSRAQSRTVTRTNVQTATVEQLGVVQLAPQAEFSVQSSPAGSAAAAAVAGAAASSAASAAGGSAPAAQFHSSDSSLQGYYEPAPVYVAPQPVVVAPAYAIVLKQERRGLLGKFRERRGSRSVTRSSSSATSTTVTRGN